MGIFEKIRNFILKLQALPEARKKIVFFSVMSVFVLLIGVLGVFFTKGNIKKIGESMGSIDLPKIDIPQSDEVASDLPMGDSSDALISLITSDWKMYTNN